MKPESGQKIALLDHEEFLVDEILQHKGVWTKISDITFLVRWANYDSSQDSWEPWSNLRRVDKMHSYLRLHNMFECYS